jgi:hypothetical protein
MLPLPFASAYGREFGFTSLAIIASTCIPTSAEVNHDGLHGRGHRRGRTGHNIELAAAGIETQLVAIHVLVHP